LPFGSYLVPGIVLFVVVGDTQALAAWGEIRLWPRAGWLSVVAGVVLAGWIAVQVAMIGLGHPCCTESHRGNCRMIAGG